MILGVFFLVSFLFLFVLGPDAAASLDDTLFQGDEPIEVNGDSVVYDSENEVYYADGNVVIVQGDVTLKADHVVMDMKLGLAEAAGNVVAYDASGNRLEGETLTADLNNDTAVVVNGRLFFKENNISVLGSEIRKTGKGRFAARQATFTTCDCYPDRSPPWSLRADSAKLKVESLLTARNAFFYIKDLPLIYTPFIAVPIKRKRQTGFLMPGIGYSRLRGKKIDNAFFWAISRSTDATFFLDIETRRGIGKGVEYRYYRTARSYGEFYFYHFNEKDIDRVREFRKDKDNLSRPKSARSGRWQLKFKHREFLDDNLTVKADINMVSDDEYFIDFGKEPGERALDSIESTVSVSKGWNTYNLTVQARVFDNLTVEHDDEVLQRLPEVIFTGSSHRIFSSPFFLSLSSSLVNFERRKGDAGQRLDARPRLSLPLSPGGWFEFTPSYAPRLTVYRNKNDASEDRYQTRFLYDVTTELTTTFVRYFNVSFSGLSKLRHTLRPKITHTYIPARKQSTLPYYDETDRVSAANNIRYSLNTTLTGKFRESGRKHDFLYMDISQTYNIREETRSKREPGDERRFSNVEGEIILRPTVRMLLTARGEYNVYDGWFEKSDASFSMSDRRGDYLSLTYRYIRGNTRYLETDARLQASRSVYLGLRQRYSFVEDELLERNLVMGYVDPCWGAELVWSRRLNETVVLLSFSLKGIGEVFSTSATVADARTGR